MNSFKVAFIGSHGVGKTTLCYGLAARLKARDISLDVVSEVARRCPLPINRQTTPAAQAWILHTQIAEELLASERYPVVICDRSVLDNFVYYLLSFGRDKALDEFLRAWMSTYDLIVRVPVISSIHADGLRSTDPGFQIAVQDKLTQELDRQELASIELDATSRDCWLDTIETDVWSLIRPAQLELV